MEGVRWRGIRLLVVASIYLPIRSRLLPGLFHAREHGLTSPISYDMPFKLFPSYFSSNLRNRMIQGGKVLLIAYIAMEDRKENVDTGFGSGNYLER